MKYLLSVFIGLTFISVHSQSMREIDSVATNICNHIPTLNEIKNDTILITTLYQTKLYPYLDVIEKEKSESVAQRIYYRLQRNCVDFRLLLERLDPAPYEFNRAKVKPTSNISKEDVQSFKRIITFMYLEHDGVQTICKLEDGIWTDQFADGTYSKLNFKWLNENEFELEFIESNNVSRSNLSYKGDKYHYQLISKEEDHFLVSASVPGQNLYDHLKFFFDF